jgi:hypothetical protein
MTATEFQQPTANSQQPTANSQQPTANSQQPTAYSCAELKKSKKSSLAFLKLIDFSMSFYINNYTISFKDTA